MNGKMERKLVERMSGSALAVILCIGLVLLCGTAVRAAQSATSSAKMRVRSAAGAANAPAHPAKSNGGNHEGITVHGWWTIEVRDPDGKVVTHREFENTLNSSGGQVLSDLLLGSAVPGGFDIHLAGPNGSLIINTPSVAASGICAVFGAICSATLVSTPSAGGFTLSGQFNVPALAAGSITQVSTDVYVCGNGTNIGNIGPLTVSNVPVPLEPTACVAPFPFGSGVTVTNGLGSLAISGPGVNYKVGDIVTVQGGSGAGTAEILATDANGGATQATILAPGTGYTAGTEVATGGSGFGLVFKVVPFTENTPAAVGYPFTSAPIAAINVTGGQTVAASVQISFQ